jgi:copper chaperone NosL
MNTVKITMLSRGLLLVVTLLFFVSLKFPMWQIDLDAPQYPEGLVLKLHADKIGGDVEIINGLNHYIGMKTLHTEDFVEFKILPYIMYFFAAFALFSGIFAYRKLVLALFISFVSFAVLAGIDFYRWNYEYGHNLDPNAAIKVPGMAYQPPVIGYKQLLNFGAYSVPDIGGWLLIGAGAIVFFILVKEMDWLSVFKKKQALTLFIPLIFTLHSCADYTVQPIKLNVDTCDFCKMTIADGKFGAEVITQKGRAYKFDDIICLKNYCEENKDTPVEKYFVHDYLEDNQFIDATKASYIKGGNISSPMNGNIAAFSDETQARLMAEKLQAEIIGKEEIIKK